jgi:hypothetical protein
VNIIEVLESNLRTAEAAGDDRAAERIRRNIEFFKARAKAGNDNQQETQK